MIKYKKKITYKNFATKKNSKLIKTAHNKLYYQDFPRKERKTFISRYNTYKIFYYFKN